MGIVMERSDTNWLDKRAYSFDSNYLDVDGGRMHYVDTGGERPILFLHGWPGWSFSFRGVMRNLMKDHRCIAPDMIGFGLSSKPEGWRYSASAHAQNLQELVKKLDLRDITLVCHDFGGPVGLCFALDNLDRIGRIVLTNTWMWDISNDPALSRAGKLALGPLGKMAYVKMNAAPKLIKPMFCDREKYTESVHKGYFGPFEKVEDRCGAFAVAKQLVEGGAWFDDLWANRRAFESTPLSLIWGTKDPSLGEKALNRIWHDFPMADVKQFPNAGRYLLEEQPQAVAEAIREFTQARKLVGYLA